MTVRNGVGVLALLSLVAGFASVAIAQQNGPANGARSTESEYYYNNSPVTEQAKPSIAQQKAQARAQHRIARIEANRRYGITPNRPTAVAVPFTSTSTLTWTRPRAGVFYYQSNWYRPYWYFSPYMAASAARR